MTGDWTPARRPVHIGNRRLRPNPQPGLSLGAQATRDSQGSAGHDTAPGHRLSVSRPPAARRRPAPTPPATAALSAREQRDRRLPADGAGLIWSPLHRWRYLLAT